MQVLLCTYQRRTNPTDCHERALYAGRRHRLPHQFHESLGNLRNFIRSYNIFFGTSLNAAAIQLFKSRALDVNQEKFCTDSVPLCNIKSTCRAIFHVRDPALHSQISPASKENRRNLRFKYRSIFYAPPLYLRPRFINLEYRYRTEAYRKRITRNANARKRIRRAEESAGPSSGPSE